MVVFYRLPRLESGPFRSGLPARLQRSAELQRLNFEPSGVDPEVELSRDKMLFAAQIEPGQKVMRLIERLRKLGEPSRSLRRRHFSWYAAHIDPRDDHITVTGKLMNVPCNLVRYGAEIV